MYHSKEIFHLLNTVWTDNFAFAFTHKEKLCSQFRKKMHNSGALYDAYNKSDDTEEKVKRSFLKGVGR